MSEKFFSPCPRGLETLLASELVSLGAENVRAIDGGVNFTGSFLLSYRINLHSRIASRVLWQVAMANYRNEQDIFELVYSLPWNDWFDVACTIRVKTTAIKSPFDVLSMSSTTAKIILFIR